MSGNFWLDSSILTLSVFNILIMLWLGSMIILNAENRNWGVFAAATGLFAGTFFFISHAAILGQNIELFNVGVSLWWHIGWAPIIATPYVWYIVMLWFSGYWDGITSKLHNRHRYWVRLTLFYAILLLVLFVFFNPLGDLSLSGNIDEYSRNANISNSSVLFLAYPIFILLCIGLSMDALARPAPARRRQGENARERARPWLISAGMLLLIASGGVGFIIQWVWRNSLTDPTLPELYGNVAPVLAWMDLGLSLLITLAVVLVGQAVVNYEVFTGKPLPRKGFRHQWYMHLFLSGCIALTASLIFHLHLRQIYLMLAAVLWTGIILAWAGWRFSDERERTIRQLRPFLFSQNISEMIFKSSDQKQNPLELQLPFNSLIHDLLGLEQGLLRITDGLTQFLPACLAFPENLGKKPIQIPSIVADPGENQVFSIEPDKYDGFEWAIPLWSQRGRDGVLMLGRKTDDSFITQEEIELARNASERMIDIMITTEFATQLVNLQREQNTQLYLMEQKPRRIIHDEILPILHTTILSLTSKSKESMSESIKQISHVHRQLSQLIREMPGTPPGRSLQVGLLSSLQEFIYHDFPDAFNSIEWQVEDQFEEKIQNLPDTSREVIDYALREVIRNAAKYAHPLDGNKPSIILKFICSPQLQVTIQDDGAGFNPDDVVRGDHGQGLHMHSLMVAIIGGSMMVESHPDSGTMVIIKI